MSWEHAYTPHLLWYSDMNPDKIICPCYKVTKGDVARAIEKGATSFKEVKKATKASKACGKCKKKVKKLTKKLLAKQPEGSGKKSEKKTKAKETHK